MIENFVTYNYREHPALINQFTLIWGLRYRNLGAIGQWIELFLLSYIFPFKALFCDRRYCCNALTLNIIVMSLFKK